MMLDRARVNLWAACLAAVMAAVSFAAPGDRAEAAGEANEVHVGLFMKTEGYSSVAGAVTLSAREGLLAYDEQGRQWMQAGAEEQVQATVDGYRVVVMETADAAKASAAASALLKQAPLYGVFTRSVSGQKMYRVEAGPYATLADAEGARGRLGGAKLAGPLYARAGTHATEAEALQAAGRLQEAGVDAFAVITPQGQDGIGYELWIGGAAGENGLQEQIAAAAGAGVDTSAATADAPYAILRTAVDAQGQELPHIAVGGAGARLSFAAADPGGAVGVAEREGRFYRGTIDIFAHNGVLAVVNRVDLEYYVASVVGSELGGGWPAEAVKAQAVAARTYVLKQGWKHGIAQVTDTTADQAYYGVEREDPAILAAAQATAGEVLALRDGTLLDAFYHSNAGGRTADPQEIWGRAIPGIESVPSLDEAAEKGRLPWYRIVFGNGTVGYVRSDYAELTGTTNAAGFPEAVITASSVNVREAPYVDNAGNPAIAQLNAGDKVTVIGQDMESTSYRWIRGPYTAQDMLERLNNSPYVLDSSAFSDLLRRLHVTKRSDVSGRVMEMSVNGTPLAVERPDHYRMVFGLPSNRFAIEETAAVSVLGGGSRTADYPQANGTTALTAVGAGGRTQALTGGAFLITDGSPAVRAASVEPRFRFIGTGNGHGLGMSQWGAYGLAELGYDYEEILQYYYKDAIIVKE